MIKGLPLKQKGQIQVKNVDYRKLPQLNQSMIKLFDDNPVQFYNEFKLGKARKQKLPSVSLILGDLVDFYILDCNGDEEEFNQKFEEKFALPEEIKCKGQMKDLAELLYNIHLENVDEFGVLKARFEVMMQEAVRIMQAKDKFKGKDFDDVVLLFEDTGRDYFDFLFDNSNKVAITDISLIDKAKQIIKNLLEDEFSKDYFQETQSIELFKKLAIEWTATCDEGSIAAKSEIDLLRVDHRRKEVQLIDLKTTYDNSAFPVNYLKNKYYLQLAFYTRAVEQWMDENSLNGYKVLMPIFLVADTSFNNRRPLIYKVKHVDLTKAFDGFGVQGVSYRGLDSLLNAIVWAETNDVWNIEKEHLNNNGVLDLGLLYE